MIEAGFGGDEGALGKDDAADGDEDVAGAKDIGKGKDAGKGEYVAQPRKEGGVGEWDDVHFAGEDGRQSGKLTGGSRDRHKAAVQEDDEKIQEKPEGNPTDAGVLTIEPEGKGGETQGCDIEELGNGNAADDYIPNGREGNELKEQRDKEEPKIAELDLREVGKATAAGEGDNETGDDD